MPARSRGESEVGSGGIMPRIGFTAIAMWCISCPKIAMRVGVPRRVTPQLLARLVGIGPAGEVVAVVERRDRALEREDLEAVRSAGRDRG